ncbi:HlyD family secretion protein [Pseudoflavitalea sp. X16]|uniref:HlyD family secretion protein n=1 Tax=Paraflavitalea devenefica TaxID=2716334 RepID=UPI00141FD368|nr:HlyD family secretion protein [Paraflavitalea devenefica]NII24711.1 HlyD family secretion protein [Paraflavitalea devenefica]
MENQPNNQTPKKKKSPLRFIILGVILIAGGYYGYTKISYSMRHESTDNAQVETQLVPVLPRVAGYVKSIAVKDYDSVKAGQLVVELDDAELQSQLLQLEADYQAAQADLSNAKAALNNALVSLRVNEGDIDINQVKLEKAQKDYNRNKNLFAEAAVTQKQLDDAKYDYETLVKELDNSHNDLASAESRISVLQAAVQKAAANIEVRKAQIEQQKLKISYTKIYAPQAGKIGKKNISEGQYVQAGAPLFTIVNDTTYWIVANFKENQITRLHPGMPVDIEVDAYPDLKLKGSVESLSDATGARFALLPPDNASGNFVKVTQRIPVKIAISDLTQHKEILRAGLSVFVSVPLN